MIEGFDDINKKQIAMDLQLFSVGLNSSCVLSKKECAYISMLISEDLQ